MQHILMSEIVAEREFAGKEKSVHTHKVLLFLSFAECSVLRSFVRAWNRLTSLSSFGGRKHQSESTFAYFLLIF
jgi:hypothetical protein